MRKCPNCGHELPDQAKFCGFCGAPAESAAPESPVCPEPAETSPAAAAPETPGTGSPRKPQKPRKPEKSKKQKKSSGKKGLILSLILILAVLTAIAGALFLSGRPREDGAFFLRNGELCFVNLRGGWNRTLTELPQDSGAEQAVFVDRTGRRLFYPAPGAPGETGFRVLRKDTGRMKEPQPAAAEVLEYRIFDDRILSICGKNRRLCLSDSETELYLAQQVQQFWAAEDFSWVIYLNTEGGLFLWDGSESRQLDADVDSVLEVYPSGEVYYTRVEAENIPLWEFFTDALKDRDAAMEEPEKPQLPDPPREPEKIAFSDEQEYQEAYLRYLERKEEYDKQCQLLQTQYDTAMEEYEEKLTRDAMRQYLEENVLEFRRLALCYGKDGKTSVTADWCGMAWALEDRPVALAACRNLTELEKLELSDLQSLEELQQAILDPDAMGSRLLAVREQKTVPVSENVWDAAISEDGSMAVFLTQSQDSGSLYAAKLEQTAVGEPVLQCSRIAAGDFQALAGGNVCAFRDPIGEAYDLYVNGIRVDTGVRKGSCSLWNNEIFYFKPSENGGSVGTLMAYSGGESHPVAEGVEAWCISYRGSALLCYCSENGEILSYRNGTTRVLTQEAEALLNIPVPPGEIR